MKSKIKDGEHIYNSTACMHGLHAECRKHCKYCLALCGCSCHNSPPAPFKVEVGSAYEFGPNGE